MRILPAIALAATLAAVGPAIADETGGRMVTLRADEIGHIFCYSRLGNDDAVISGILTADLAAAIAAARKADAAFAKAHPGDKPPLGDGIPWQSRADQADNCDVGLVSLSRMDARVEIRYGFKADPNAGYIDVLLLKKVPIEGTDAGRWRIDDLSYTDGGDLRGALRDAFTTN